MIESSGSTKNWGAMATPSCMIEAYRKETEIELSEADVRAEVPKEMAGRETT